ncbi:uncharacterized protein BJX67DRAFT_368273 [Aspergillus lucknowensis]|uniref:Uncharacterized protein n=1 Tax=Aspergillus lucknowensis TaxID=176173 RepID=A0ABR4L940_9EURO
MVARASLRKGLWSGCKKARWDLADCYADPKPRHPCSSGAPPATLRKGRPVKQSSVGGRDGLIRADLAQAGRGMLRGVWSGLFCVCHWLDRLVFFFCFSL